MPSSVTPHLVSERVEGGPVAEPRQADLDHKTSEVLDGLARVMVGADRDRLRTYLRIAYRMGHTDGLLYAVRATAGK